MSTTSVVEYASFFVRLCRRRSPGADTSPAEWHGEVEHVQTGMRWEFDNAEDLLAFLTQKVTHPSTWHTAE